MTSDIEISNVFVEGTELLDHDLIFCNMNETAHTFTSFSYTYRDYKHFNIDDFHSDLLSSPLHTIYRASDTDKKVATHRETLLRLFDLHAPLKTIFVNKPKTPWITDNIKFLIKLRDKV